MNELIEINPADVIVGSNVRLDPSVDRQFVASIRERGVLVPVVGHRAEDGRFVVLYGQRRTLAATQAGRATIPAYVVGSPDEADRLIDQMAENDHRAALSITERAQAFEQLAALGLSAAQIARKTASSKGEVAAALTVAASPETASKAEQRGLSLEQAAALTEFSENAEAMQDLLSAAEEGPGAFAHTLQVKRDGLARDRAVAAETTRLTEAGVTVIDRPGYSETKTVAIHRLADAKGKKLTEKSHAGCPGHVAYVDTVAKWEGPQGKERRVWLAQAGWACADWRAHGHTDRYASTSNRTPAAQMSETERAEAAAARREVIEGNKAWDSAEAVRREWLARFAARKSAPKGSAGLIARMVTEHHHEVNSQNGDTLAASWYNLTRNGYAGHEWAKVLSTVSDPRAQVITVARLLASLETSTSRATWRQPSGMHAMYLNYLAAAGYELSPIEKRVTQGT